MKKRLLLSRHYSVLLLITVIFLSVNFLAAAVKAEERQALQQKVKQFLGVDTLAPEHRRGFMYELTIRAMYEQLSPDLKKVADQEITLQEPVRQFSVLSPSGHFHLNYDLTGVHAVPAADISGNGIPDFVDSAATYLDHVWQVEIEELGFQPPLNILGEPVLYLNIYFTNFLSQGYRGFYGSTELYEEIASLPGQNYASYIELHHNFEEDALYTKGLDGLRVTCAHEFNHAVQVGYRVWFDNFQITDRYFFEMTSTWLEEYVYADVNDYFQYLPGLFSNIQSIAITINNFPYMYANGIFLFMLSTRYEPEIVVDIWEQIREEKAINAMQTVLKKRGSSFEEELNEYGKWMYFTGTRSIPDLFFHEGSAYPEVKISPAAFYNASKNVSAEIAVKNKTFYYVQADSVNSLRSLAKIDAFRNNGQLRINYFNDLDYFSNSVPAGDNKNIVLNFIPQDLTFVLSNARDSSVTVNFTLNTDTTIVPDPDTLRTRVAFGPNPAVINDGFSKHFYNVAPGSKIYIMDLNQRPVRTLKNDLNVDAIVQWDMRDNDGRYVSSGVYFFIVTQGSRRQTGKIAVVR